VPLPREGEKKRYHYHGRFERVEFNAVRDSVIQSNNCLAQAHKRAVVNKNNIAKPDEICIII